ncbi:MAG: hypothetical protein F6J87_13380 [Spirulina sp. SIO3F2]|nr:hypothetical protein [Spirulina sp. SIO3F2]
MKHLAVSALYCAGFWTLLFPTVSLAQAQNYPTNERQSFVESCANLRGSEVRAICACTFEKIKARYSYEEYRSIRQRIDNGSQLPAPVVKMIEDCRRSQS